MQSNQYEVCENLLENGISPPIKRHSETLVSLRINPLYYGLFRLHWKQEIVRYLSIIWPLTSRQLWEIEIILFLPTGINIGSKIYFIPTPPPLIRALSELAYTVNMDSKFTFTREYTVDSTCVTTLVKSMFEELYNVINDYSDYIYMYIHIVLSTLLFRSSSATDLWSSESVLLNLLLTWKNYFNIWGLAKINQLIFNNLLERCKTQTSLLCPFT